MVLSIKAFTAWKKLCWPVNTEQTCMSVYANICIVPASRRDKKTHYIYQTNTMFINPLVMLLPSFTVFTECLHKTYFNLNKTVAYRYVHLEHAIHFSFFCIHEKDNGHAKLRSQAHISMTPNCHCHCNLQLATCDFN